MAESSLETNLKEVTPRDGSASENNQVFQHSKISVVCSPRQIPTPQSEVERSDHNAQKNAETGQPDEQASACPDDSQGGSEGDLQSKEGENGSGFFEPAPTAYPYIARPGTPTEISFGSRPRNMANITVRTRTQLKQNHDDYILLLEDRITRLENSLSDFLAKPPVPPTPPTDSFVPKVTELFWSDYHDLMGYGIRDGLAAIEVLVDLPSARGRNYVSTPDQNSFDTNLQSPAPRQSIANTLVRSTEPLGNMGNLPWRVRINSHWLLVVLNRVSDKFFPLLPPEIFRWPFKPFVYYEKSILETIAELRKSLDREAIERIENKLKEPVETDPVITSDRFPDAEGQCLLYELTAKFIAMYLQPVRAKLSGHNRVQFHELWFLFEPGQYVFVREKNCPQNVWRVLQTTGGNPYLRKQRFEKPLGHPPLPPRMRTHRDPRGLKDSREISNPYLSPYDFSPFLIDCYYIDFDGIRFRPVYRRFQIPSFGDNLLVSSLTVIPLAVAEGAGIINQDVRRRIGEQYLDCTKPSHRHFEGRTLDRNSVGNRLYLQTSEEWRTERRAVQESLEGKVMVDLTTAAEAQPEWQPSYDELDSYNTPLEELQTDGIDLGDEGITDDYVLDQRRRDDFEQKEFTKFKLWNAETGTKPEGQDLLLLPDRVYAFVLRTRKWGKFCLHFVASYRLTYHSLSPTGL